MRDFGPAVLKMREYFVYFPFLELCGWGKRPTEARSSHLSGVALESFNSVLYFAIEN